MSHSDDSQVLLAPSFKPPKPVEFQRTSEHNKIGILLALRPAFSTDRSKGHHSQSLEWAAGYDKKVCNTKSAVPSSQDCGKSVACLDAKRNDIELFDGGIVIKQNSSQIASASVMATSKTADKGSESMPRDGLFSSVLNAENRDKRPAPRSTPSSSKRTKSANEINIVTTKSSKESSDVGRSSSKLSGNSRGRTISGNESGTLWSDVSGIESFCRNAGSCAQSLSLFEELCFQSSRVALCFLWDDGSSNLTETSRKLCTPSRPCNRWHCACDRSVRTCQTKRNLVAAAVCLGMEDGEYVYLLPLENTSTALRSGESVLCEMRCAFTASVFDGIT